MLRIGEAQLEALRRHGEEAYPAEACGVLLGPAGGPAGSRVVTEVLPCANSAREPSRFAIDEWELLRIAKASRARGQEVVGFYHSHPDAPPAPSPTDLLGASWPGCSWVITRVAGGRAGETRSYRLEPDPAAGPELRFRPEPLDAVGR